ncbi:Nuclear cap-binding protein subunit 1 [Entophlyctis luteolus]|nr:Nuclear cap-binding protein subunit 1 [Entophlyctis luteolus]
MRPENALFVELSGGTKHELKDFEMPAELDFNMSEIPTQEPIFWVFDDSVNTPENILANLPPTHKIERYIMDDLTLDTIHLLSHNHIEAAHFLLNMDKFHKDTDFSFHQCHVENLIRELIKLPVSQELEIYYATLLFDLCKGAPGKVPSAMGRSLRIMFARMDNENVGSGGGMDVECVKRLGEWFSHHLSNFSFLWKWHEWDFGLQDPSSAKFSFIRETLDREIRLSYYDRIAGTVPEVFMNHESVFPKTAPSFNYKYGSDFETTDKDLQTLLSRLHRELTSKADSSTVSSVLEDILAHRRNTYASAMTSDEMLAAKPAVVWSEDVVVRDIFVQNILFLGTKSFSHFLNVVERYVKILQQFNEQPEHKLRTVRIIADFWKHHTLNLEIVLDKLMNYRIIDPTSIISWVLDMDLLETEYSRWHIWTILRNVTAKVNSKVSQLRKKIGVDAMEEDDSATQEALDQAIRDQKAAFIDIFKKFQECLLQVQAQGEGPGSSAKWRWISGEMREFGRHHHAEIHKLKFTLEATAFIEPLESHVGKIWNEIKALGDLLAMQ